jgi:hypothetical protein
MNYFLEPNKIFRVVGHDEELKGHFLIREKYESPMMSQSGGWDTTFKLDGWMGTAWHKLEDETPVLIGKTYNQYIKGSFYFSEFEIIEMISYT